jgi:hypothetical protein
MFNRIGFGIVCEVEASSEEIAEPNQALSQRNPMAMGRKSSKAAVWDLAAQIRLSLEDPISIALSRFRGH